MFYFLHNLLYQSYFSFVLRPVSDSCCFDRYVHMRGKMARPQKVLREVYSLRFRFRLDLNVYLLLKVSRFLTSLLLRSAYFPRQSKVVCSYKIMDWFQHEISIDSSLPLVFYTRVGTDS